MNYSSTPWIKVTDEMPSRYMENKNQYLSYPVNCLLSNYKIFLGYYDFELQTWYIRNKSNLDESATAYVMCWAPLYLSGKVPEYRLAPLSFLCRTFENMEVMKEIAESKGDKEFFYKTRFVQCKELFVEY